MTPEWCNRGRCGCGNWQMRMVEVLSEEPKYSSDDFTENQGLSGLSLSSTCGKPLVKVKLGDLMDASSENIILGHGQRIRRFFLMAQHFR
ncbi:hypothetical protein YC2023_033542 [Brassica napus]